MDKESQAAHAPPPETSKPTNRHSDRHPTELDGAEGNKLSRQNFLKMGIGTLTALALLEITGAGILFLKPRSLEGQFGGVVKIGPIDSFPPGSVTEFPDGHFFLVRANDGGFLATYSRCPHLGCTVNWEPYNNQFYCPCHASSFDLYGNFETPPVPRALDIFLVQISGDTVVVDTSVLQRRKNFSEDELVYA